MVVIWWWMSIFIVFRNILREEQNQCNKQKYLSQGHEGLDEVNLVQV